MMVKGSQNVLGEQAVVAGTRKSASLDRMSHKSRSRTNSGPLTAKGSNICEVILIKVARKGLGIGLASFGTIGRFDYGIYVKYIAKGSSATAHGKLRLKDVLLSINKGRLDDKSVEDIYRILRNLPPGPVHLLVKRTLNSYDNDEKEESTNTSFTPSKLEAKENIVNLMCPALPSKGRQTSGIRKSFSTESDQDISIIPTSRTLKRSNSADVKKEMLNKQNWFSYIESNEGKKHVPATKGSLGIDYGKNVNSAKDFNTIIKKIHADKEGKREPNGDRKKVLFHDTVNKTLKSNKVHKNIKNPLPDQATLATILSPVKHDSSPGTNLNNVQHGKDVNTSVCKANEIPEGMEPHVVEIVKDDKTSLGISLVPATEKYSGLFQVRFIFPGTAAANNGNVFCGDYIFSVNGIKLYNMSHPQAIHILKKCTVKCKLIVFREMKTNASKRFNKLQKGKDCDEGDLKTDIIPGTISEKSVETNTNPIRSKVFKSRFYPETESKNDNKEELKISDSDETDDETSPQDNVADDIPQCISVNKRTRLGPFMIEHEKKSKVLGIGVMMDEFGQCNITDISPNGSIANDKRIRTGDILIAINNQLLSGKPISDVKAFIRSIPKGLVQLIIKTANTESECSSSPRSIQKNSLLENVKPDDTVSINSSVDSSEDHSERLSTSSLMLPPDNSKGSLMLPVSLCKSQLPLHDDTDSLSPFSHDRKNIRDDISDMVSLPPAPPRPIVSQKLLDSLQFNTLSTSKNMHDNMSDVASLSPAPRPITENFERFEQCNVNESYEDKDSDLESMYSCIPAPPPPIENSKRLNKSQMIKTISGSSLMIECDNDSVLDESTQKNIEDGHQKKKKIYVETPLSMVAKTGSQSSGSHKDITTNYNEVNEEESKRRSVIDYLESNTHEDQENIYEDINACRNEKDVTKNEEGDGEFTPPIFDIKEILDSPVGSNRGSRATSFSSHESVSVFPEGIVVYNENKKRTLFSKLKSKILLPSKGNAQEYTSPSKDHAGNMKDKHTKDKKKQKQRPVSSLEFYDTPDQSPKNSKDKKKKKQRPLSALNFSDESTRSTLKASISQPDLTSMSSHEVDLMFRKKGSESPAIRCVQDWLVEPNKCDTSRDRNHSQSSNESLLSTKSQLPRILPTGKSPKKTNSVKKTRKQASSHVSSVSPPHTPPPPPPSEFTHEDEVDITNENVASCSNDDMPTSQVDIGYPEKLLAGYSIPLGDKCMSESSSSIPGSYAAFGPTITSANVSMDNLDTTYDVIDGKVLLNTTYELNGGGKQINTTYEVCEDDQVDIPNDYDDDSTVYESIEDAGGKPKPVPKPAHLEVSAYPSSSVLLDDYTSTSNCEENIVQEGYHCLEEVLNDVHTQPLDQSCSETNENKTVSTPTTTTDISNNHGQSCLHKRQASELSEKDKLDPKLQPFIMTQGVSALLRTWPSEPSKSKTCSSPYSDYDDDGWGSEFSSNVLDYSSTPDSLNRSLSRARRISVLKNLDNSADATHSIEEFTPSAENPSKSVVEPTVTPKTKGRDFRNFFSRGNKNENRNDGGEKRLGKKEKRKLIKSAALPEKNLHIASSRKNEIEVQRSNDHVTNTTEVTFDNGKTLPQQKVKDGFNSLKGRKNPIPKPPRRISADNVPINTNYTCEYANLEDYNKSVNNETFQFRPVPPFPDEDEDTNKNITPLSPEEHNELYASINYNAKTNRKLVFDSNVNGVTSSPEDELYASIDYNVQRNLGDIDGDNGYISDGTVYSVPERNNSPGYSPEMHTSPYSTIKKVNKEGGFNSFNSVDEETTNEEVMDESIDERHDEIFAVELTKEHGKCLGISLIGGSDTPIVKNLIKSVDDGSIASKCRILLQPGDEIIEINGEMVIGYTHSQLLRVIRESPPLLQFQLHRSADGNIGLLREQEYSEKVMSRKIDSEKIIANLTASSHNIKGTEILSLDNSSEENEVNDTDAVLSVETFELKKTKDVSPSNNNSHTPSMLQNVSNGPAHLPPTGTRVNRPNTPKQGHNAGNDSRSSTPTRHTVSSDYHEPNVVKVIEIELHKETGRGLGISVTGGPKHIIKNGIKVKRLSPNSIAYIDGRLQKEDHIVAINGNIIKGMSQGEALNMLQNIKSTVILTVHRPLSIHNEENDCEPKNTIHQSDLVNKFDQSTVGDLKKYNSEAYLLKATKNIDKNDSKGRSSRSETKKDPRGRSQSETRELKRKPSTRSRSRSPGIFSRIFRGSDRSIKGDTSTKDKKCSSRKNSDVESDNQYNDMNKELHQAVKSKYPHTIYFDKCTSSLDFTLTRGGKMYGDSPTVVQSIKKGSVLSKSLFMGDIVLSINGVSLQDFSDTELKKFLRSLPKGTIPMVIQRN